MNGIPVPKLTSDKLRIGVDCRFLTHPEAVNRGFGRYSRQQLLETLKRDTTNEYWLYCYEGTNRDLLSGVMRANPNVVVRNVIEQQPLTQENVSVVSKQFQKRLAADKINVFHQTTNFVMDSVILTDFDVCPLVMTHYDLIPLVYANQYLTDQTTWAMYHAGVQALKSADILIAISEAVKQEAVDYLGFDPDAIRVAYPIPDPVFRPLPDTQTAAALGELTRRNNFRLGDKFILSVPGFHHSKNVEGLLRAYSLLPRSLRAEYPLVFTFAHTPDVEIRLRELGNQYGIASNIILTGFVSDEDLACLYNAATIYAHPSRYEGFGLPVVEAMRCGTPVVTTTAAALAEIAGDAALLADPEDAAALAEALERALRDPNLRETMSARGLERAQQFNETQLAEHTLEAYEQAAQVRRTPRPRRRRVAFWSPLPPQRSGIADYSVELLQHLSLQHDVEVFIDHDYEPLPALRKRLKIFQYRDYEVRDAFHPFDVNLYQLGNSTFHNYILSQMERVPGIAVIHDVAMGSLFHFNAIAENALDRFRAELTYSDGARALQVFNRLINSPNGHEKLSEEFYSKFFMLRRILERTTAQIVHMPVARTAIEAVYPVHHLEVVNEGVTDPLAEVTTDRAHLRRELDLEPDSFVVGALGIIAPIKQIDVCVRAIAGLVRQNPNALLVVVGEAVNSTYQQSLRDMVAEFGIEANVRFVGYAPKELFTQYLVACDVIVNLRYPSMMQMSAVLTRAIAAGKPVIVSDIPEWAFLPEDFCWRVDPLDTAGSALEAYLRRLMNDPLLRAERGQNARTFYERELTAELMAERYSDVIERYMGMQPPLLPSAPILPPVVRAQPTIETSSTMHMVRHWFAVWNATRLKQDIRGLGRWLSRIPVLGFIFRTLVRVRNLGRAWTAEAQFFLAIIGQLAYLEGKLAHLEQMAQDAQEARGTDGADRNGLQDQRLDRYDQRFETLEHRLQDVVSGSLFKAQEQRLERLELQMQQLLNADVWQAQDQRLNQIEEQLRQTASVAIFRDASQRIDQLDAQTAELTERVRETVSQVRATQYRMVIPAAEPAPELGPLSLLTSVVQTLERRCAALTPEQTVDIVLRGGSESQLFHLANYLGSRIEVVKPQVWYWFDLDVDWNKHFEIANPAARLAEDTYLVLVICQTDEIAPTVATLRLVAEESLQVSDVRLRAWIWQKPPKAAATSP